MIYNLFNLNLLIKLASGIFVSHVSYRNDVTRQQADIKDMKRGGRIVYGTDLNISETPFMAQLTWDLKSQFDVYEKVIYCGGSLISYRHVLTAGHCVPTRRTYGFFGMKDEGHIYVGTTLLISGEKSPSSKVERIFIHPKFNIGVLPYPVYDIAVCKSDSDLSMNPIAKPISLPGAGADINSVKGNLYTAGWGHTEEGSMSRSLKFRNISLSPEEECSKTPWYLNLVWDRQVMVCTSDSSVTCLGDSGSPIFGGQPVTVWAVVSYSVSLKCTDPPDVFARVDTTVGFIESVLARAPVTLRLSLPLVQITLVSIIYLVSYL